MPRWIHILVGAVAIAGVVVALWGGRLVVYYFADFDRQFHDTFQTVEAGMTEAEVVHLLGRPIERDLEFRLGQYEGYEGAYADANESGAVHYLRWFNGIDIVYSVGVDEAGNVVHVAFGGT